MFRYSLSLLFFAAGCSEHGLVAVNKITPEPEDTGEWMLEEESETATQNEEEETPEHEEPNNEGPSETEEPEEEQVEEEHVEEEEVPPPPEDDCDDTSDLVYVIDRDEEAIYLFDPTDYSFDFVGDLDCGMFAGSPGSMTVTRTGSAYVRYSDNTVYEVDLLTMDCTETAYGNSGFGAFGMGYATHSSSSWMDTLYFANANQLSQVNTQTWSLTNIGTLSSQSELTGNADGELWAILPLESPAKLVELDKSSAQVVTTHNLNNFPDPYNIDTFAFATWGGEFYIFIRSYGMGNSTDVYKVSSNGSMSLVAPDTGMDVVGAGVSTCAPTH